MKIMKLKLIISSLALGATILSSGCLARVLEDSTPEGCSVSAGQAKRSADAFQGVINNQWGESLDAVYNAEQHTYEVIYDTSQEEIDFLGERSVIVNCVTGETNITFRD